MDSGGVCCYYHCYHLAVVTRRLHSVLRSGSHWDLTILMVSALLVPQRFVFTLLLPPCASKGSPSVQHLSLSSVLSIVQQRKRGPERPMGDTAVTGIWLLWFQSLTGAASLAAGGEGSF